MGKKILFFHSMVALMCVLFLSGCGQRPAQEGEKMMSHGSARRLRVAATLFPYYDFVRQIAGEDVCLTLVVPAGMDSHSFEPTPADMRAMQSADLLVCNGGAMETWLKEALGAIDTSQMAIVTMMDHVAVVEEEIVEGMEGTGQEDGHHDRYGAKVEYDEHIWTSPANAAVLAGVIRDVLMELDPPHAKNYDRRAKAYLQELEDIDEAFRQVGRDRCRDTIVVGDKFPFRYLADTYGFGYRAAFPGCSSDTEPSARTIAYLIDKIRAEGIPVVYYLELSSRRVSEIISEETGARPLLLHSCHSVTRAEFEQGATYVDLMWRNVENLRKGLDE